jgi:hypothetical protein
LLENVYVVAFAVMPSDSFVARENVSVAQPLSDTDAKSALLSRHSTTVLRYLAADRRWARQGCVVATDGCFLKSCLTYLIRDMTKIRDR